MTYDIESGLKATENVTTQGYQVFTAAQLLASSIANIQTKFASTVQSMMANAVYLATAMGSIDTFTINTIDKRFTRILYFVQGVLLFVLVGSALVLLGVLGTYYF